MGKIQVFQHIARGRKGSSMQNIHTLELVETTGLWVKEEAHKRAIKRLQNKIDRLTPTKQESE